MSIKAIIGVGALILFGPPIVLAILLSAEYGPAVGAVAGLVFFLVSVITAKIAVQRRAKASMPDHRAPDRTVDDEP